MAELAQQYERGEGVPVDMAKCTSLNRTASLKGDEKARLWLTWNTYTP